MAQFPVEDQTGMLEAVNALLSGPSGLGQNFQGFSAYKPSYFTGTYRRAFSVPVQDPPQAPPPWYVAPLTITGITQITAYAFEVTFTGWSGTEPPFFPGQFVTIANTTCSGADPNFYNDYYTVPGVLACTTTTVTIGTGNAYTFPAWVSGGEVFVDVTDTNVSTDCNARVTVQGGTDQVFVSAQIQLDFDYTVVNPGNLTLYVKVNRYYAVLDVQTTTNRDYIFLSYPDSDNKTVSQQSETFTLTTSGTQSSRDFVFTTVLDSGLPKNYYWYILEIDLLPDVIGDIYVNSVTGNLRSLTAQVIKQ
jgi:hypothetical protein